MDKNFLAPAEIVDAAVNAGKAKAERSVIYLLIMGVLAGAFIALAAQGSNMAAFNLLSDPSTYGLGRCLAGALFAIGLMLVVITGAELFTGNTLIITAVFEKKTTIGKMLKNWVLVYIGNFIGSIIIVLIIANIGQLNGGGGLLGTVTVNIAVSKVSMSFWGVLLSGILCNWLVCLGVWLAFAADTVLGKMFGCFFPIWLFVTSGFEHCVANMYYIPAGILAKAVYGTQAADVLAGLNWGTFVTNNLIPATIGNIIGGALCVGTAYWYTLKRSQK